MKPGDVIDAVRRKVKLPEKGGGFKTVIAVTAGAASAIWLALRVRKDLYGPGGTRLSRYDRSIDKPRQRKKS